MPFAPTPTEVGLVNAIFAVADPQKLGLVTGEQGIRVFAGSKLPPATLGDIWALADPENNGALTRRGVAVTVRLIGWAQNGEAPSAELLDRPGPSPVIEGIVAPAAATSQARAPAPIATLSSALPPLLPTDRAKFLNVYNKAGPVNGLVSGESARNTFIRSKLSLDRLNAIWGLVDTTNRGSLDAAQFILAMYFIQGSMSANPTIPVLPPSVPAFLWEQAGGRPPSVNSHTTGDSVPSPGLHGPGIAGAGVARAFSPQYTGGSGTSHQPGSTIGSQFTGFTAQTTGSRLPPSIPNRPSNFPVTPQLTGSPFPLARPPAAAPAPWDVTADEKVKSDGFFDNLDTARLGYVEGGAAVPFMLLSGLSEDILARVWDLADMRNDGRLTKDTFAVAMHLINGVLEGKDLPATLPASLVPPSLRLPASPFPNAAFPGSQSSFALQQQNGQYPSFAQPAPAPAMSEAHRDLWDLNDTPVEPPKPTSPPPMSTLSPHTTGQGLNAQYTGAFSPQPQATQTSFSAPSRSFNHDLLEDEEIEPRQMKQLSDNTMAIGNARNQLSSTQNAQASAEKERADLETQVATSAATLSQLQTQLASAKVGYETETRLLEGLRERYTAQSKEIKDVREQLISAESELSAVKLEKAEIGGSLLREKDDVRDLKRRLQEVLDETTNVKKEVEGVKKEVRLQRGLLVIAKKQLSTAETELEETKKSVQDALAERDEATAEVKAAEDSTTRLKEEIAKVAASPKQTGGAAIGAFTPGSGAGTPKGTGTPKRTVSPAPAVTSPPLPFADASTLVSPAMSTKSNNPFDRLRGASVGSDMSIPGRSASPFAMPAEVSATPTPDINARAAVASPIDDDDDPFGFNEGSGGGTPAIATTSLGSPKPAGFSTPKKQDSNFLDTTASSGGDHLISPTDTSFFTPPSSSAGANILDGLVSEQRDMEAQRIQTSEQLETGDGLHHPATKFPDLTSDLTSIHDIDTNRAATAKSGLGDFTAIDNSNVDLDLPPLQEIVEKDETDSDSEGEDDKPLGEVKAEKKAQAAIAATSTQAPEPVAAKAPEPASFDDAFGFDAPAATVTAPTTAPTTAPSSHFSALGSEKAISSPATSAATGINGHAPEKSAFSAFDEAFGTLPPATVAPPAALNEPFKFDNFEDTFDFGEASFTHARTTSGDAAIPANVVANPPAVATPASAAFDDAFGFPATAAAAVTAAPTMPRPGPAPAAAPLSFDDAFEVSTNEQQASKSVSFAAPESPTSTQQAHDTPGQNGTSVRSLSPSAARGSSSSFGRPPSPSQTSLPRATPRPPKENSNARPVSKYESDGAGSSRSRLSLHLPFGRSKSSKEKKEKEKEDKKKEKEKKAQDKHAKEHPTGGVMPPVPPVPRSFTAISERDEGPDLGTPAEDGDLPVLKQLLEYGFPREQAVEALENSGYNFQRALNKLVSQPS